MSAQQCVLKHRRASARTSCAGAPRRWPPRASASPRPPSSCTARSARRGPPSPRWPSARACSATRSTATSRPRTSSSPRARGTSSPRTRGRTRTRGARSPTLGSGSPTASTRSTPTTSAPRRCSRTCCATPRWSPRVEPALDAVPRLRRGRRARSRRGVGRARASGARWSRPRRATRSTSRHGARWPARAASAARGRSSWPRRWSCAAGRSQAAASAPGPGSATTSRGPSSAPHVAHVRWRVTSPPQSRWRTTRGRPVSAG